MNVPLRLGRTIAGFGIVGLVVAGFIHLPTSNSQQVEQPIGQSPRFSSLLSETLRQREASPTRRFANAIDLPMVPPIVTSDPTSEGFRPAEAPITDLTITARVDVPEKPPVRLSSAQIALKEAKLAVSLSQVQLAQARINLSEFQAKHDTAKIFSAQGKVNRQQAATARAAHKLAQLQHSSATIGLQESQAQLIAAQAEISKLGCKANAGSKM